MKNKPLEQKSKRKIYPQIIITALAALGCIALAILVHWLFIIPGLILWWMNKKSLKNIGY